MVVTKADDELIAAAELGDEALRFTKSDLFRCMLGIADQEISLALDKLLTVDPDDAKKIREIQNDAKVAGYFKEWLSELIDKGNAALEVYRHGQEK